MGRDASRVDPIQDRFVKVVFSIMRQYENCEDYSEGKVAEDLRTLLRQYDTALKEKAAWKLTQVEAKAASIMPINPPNPAPGGK